MPDAAPSSDDGFNDAEDPGDSVHPLLEIQRLDTETEQLRHRRATLDQRRDLSAARAERAERQQEIDTVALQRIEVLIRQKRLEDQAAIVESKADTDDNRLYSGEVRAIRDLQALQQEIAGLRSRQGELEERSIEALMEAEELAERAAALETQRARIDERVTVLEAELAAAEEAIDEQLGAVHAARAEASALADGGALASYERLRPAFGPSTAVAFDPSSGCGCPHQMPAVEVARIKRCPVGSMQDCSECGRIVLR